MQITLSERRFSERIRELEGIGPEVTVEEITHRLDQYARKLFTHLAAYGLTSIGLLGMNGSLGTFQVTLERCWDDESRNKRIQGLAMLDPLSVTLEQNDLGAFFVGGLLTTMYDKYPDYAHELQRVTVGELDAALQRIAERLAFAPQAPLFTPMDAEDAEALQEFQDEEFRLWCLRSGLKVPGAERQARDAAEQAEIARIEAARKKSADDFYNGRS
jgi:hypothetical protein